MKSYRVRYRIESKSSATNSSTTIMLHSASESEAIAMLRRRGTVSYDDVVIILSIEPA